ncbi:bifunctional DNA-formamidopyrimidine glycosylase/DNA-(apurinic or apyrimidinic site) lyase [Candidatus Roizmanbacteria bacterium]|nr:bifunctional DNA-formamidopyrimidine glycosylase/DNA-(apurinic or apyrimidinic site) lyase [Candidatus Roizmanbacteria bacterium]
MPELPEVETIRLGLEKYIVGKTIIGVEVRLKKMVTGDPKNIIGAKVTEVRRFGKGLVIDLDNGYSITAHIKLTGQFIYEGEDVSRDIHKSIKTGGSLPNKWTHVIFKLNKGSVLYYNDLRQFGWVKIIKTPDLKTLSFFKDLGPEPFKDLNLEKFKAIISKSNLAIKPLLMDQKRIGGIGNIYANDALFDAKIDPRRSAKKITQEEIKRLYDSILKVLKKGLESGGASELSFVNVLGEDGGYQKHFLIYGREGEICKRCGNKIQKIRLGGRGTYFCPKCQK